MIELRNRIKTLIQDRLLENLRTGTFSTDNIANILADEIAIAINEQEEEKTEYVVEKIATFSKILSVLTDIVFSIGEHNKDEIREDAGKLHDYVNELESDLRCPQN